MFQDLFNKKKFITVQRVSFEDDENSDKPVIPDGMWSKCEGCGAILYKEDIEKNLNVCPKCDYHFKITPKERISITFDEGSFNELHKDIGIRNPLDFPKYYEKVTDIKNKTQEDEAVVCGIGKINGIKVCAAIMSPFFMMGSMGTVVGEKITRIIEEAIRNKLPLIIFTASGGARMQEGMFSLMQMAKVSAAIGKHDLNKLLYITVLTHPTTGGVTASFAMEGDIILSEPKALVGFAGRRVIENTINQDLPENFQTAEFLIKKGFIDKIVKRSDMKDTLYNILKLHEVNRDG